MFKEKYLKSAQTTFLTICLKLLLKYSEAFLNIITKLGENCN